MQGQISNMKTLAGAASPIEGFPFGKLRDDREAFLVSSPPFALFHWNTSLEAAGVCVLTANRGKSWH